MVWADNAPVGKRVVYAHRKDGTDKPPTTSYSLASAFRAHKAGLVFIAQRRKPSGWDYEATRISQETAKVLRLLEDNR
jgi:hypothetical protein